MAEKKEIDYILIGSNGGSLVVSRGSTSRMLDIFASVVLYNDGSCAFKPFSKADSNLKGLTMSAEALITFLTRTEFLDSLNGRVRDQISNEFDERKRDLESALESFNS